MSFIEKQKKKLKPKSLKHHLHQKLAGWEEARSHKIVHASDLTKDGGWCPRAFALLDITGKKPKGQYVGTSLRYTFDTGDKLQEMLTLNYAKDIAVGHWKCLYCGQVHQFQKHPGSCKGCGCKALTYKEVRFTSDDGYDGNVDLLVDLGEPLLRLIEVKTIKPDDFKELPGPLAEHRWRTNLYLRLVDTSDKKGWAKRINTSEAFIFYLCKGFGCKDDTLAENGIKDAGFSPFKEFPVSRNDKLTDEIVGRSRELKEFRAKTGKMPAGICPNSYCKRAAACSVVAECFSGSYPAGV